VIGVDDVKCEYRVNGLTGRFQLNASDILTFLKKVRKVFIKPAPILVRYLLSYKYTVK